ncbi:hypothetical protein GCM10023142_35000 [Anaerocolumna aminovalerica]
MALFVEGKTEVEFYKELIRHIRENICREISIIKLFVEALMASGDLRKKLIESF